MERGRGRIRCAVGGGIALGAGTLLFALCSPSSVSCATNIVVLTHGTVTARSCAAYSLAAHIGVGLIVLGAVLLTGAFLLAVRHRRQTAGESTPPPAPAATAAPGVPAGSVAPSGAATPVGVSAGSPTTPIPPGPGRAVGTPDAPVPPGGRAEPSPPTGPSGPGYPEVERRRGDRRARRSGPIAPGEDVGPPPGPMPLPPGWYGNPDNPGGPVQWWDGTKLTDRRP